MAAVTSAVAAVASVGIAASSASSQKKAASRAQDSADAANATAADLAQQQQDISNQQWDNYKTNYLPLEQSNLEQAKNYGSIANQEKAATNAAGAVAGSFAGARDTLNKTAGLDPNSQQYLREVARMGISEAASSAASQTAARQGVADKGAAMLSDAAALGKGVSGNAVASLNAASSASSGIAGAANNFAANAYGRAQSAAGGVGQMIGGLSQNKNVAAGFSDIGNWAKGLFSPSVAAPTPIPQSDFTYNQVMSA